MTGFTNLCTAMFKGFFRDRVSVFFTVLFLLFFIVVFGVLLAGGGSNRQQVIAVGNVPLIDVLPAAARTQFDDVITLTREQDLAPALAQVRQGKAAAAVTQQGNRLELCYFNGDPVGAATVRGVCSSFVDQANIAVNGRPPTFALGGRAVGDESLKAIQCVSPQMIAYCVSVGAVFGAALTLITCRERKVLRRQRLAPEPTITIVGARVVVPSGWPCSDWCCSSGSRCCRCSGCSCAAPGTWRYRWSSRAP